MGNYSSTLGVHKQQVRYLIQSDESFNRLALYEDLNKDVILNVLVDSFSSPADPLFQFIAYDKGVDGDEVKSRFDTMTKWMLSWVNYPLFDRGIILTALDDSGDIAAVATLSPPDIPQFTTFTNLRNGIMLGVPPCYSKEKEWGSMAKKRLKALSVLDKRRDEFEKHFGGFWYLQSLGTLQSKRRQGHGGRLLRAMFKLADKQQKAIYLETESEANEKYYHSFGFTTEAIEEVVVPVVDEAASYRDQEPFSYRAKLWLMIRRPNTASLKSETS